MNGEKESAAAQSGFVQSKTVTNVGNTTKIVETDKE